MEIMVSNERDIVIDLESGGNEITSEEEDTRKDLVLNVITRVPSRFLGSSGSIGGVHSVDSCRNVDYFSAVVDNSVEFLIERNSGGEESEERVVLVDSKHVKVKRQKTKFKKTPKPPRPPKGPAMDAADLMMVREISELAMKKRARIEHMKALKKMKAARSSSSSSNNSFGATIITVLFFVVILFQGICSRSSSSMGFHGSPEPAVAADSLVSV